MFHALVEWCINRNKCVQSVAKSEPDELTITVDKFIAMKKTSALDGRN